MGKTHYDQLVAVRGFYVGPVTNEVPVTGDGGELLYKGAPFTPIRKLAQAIAVGGFTDGGSASGYIDLTSKLPAGAIPLGWRFVGSGAFDGDTSAVLEVGVSGDTDRFSADTAGSVFAVATIGSLAIAADACKGIAAEVTVRVTVTTAADFTACKTSGKGAGTLELYYLVTG